MSESLSDCMALLMLLGMLNTMEEMGREFIRPELEKRLGHPVTDWNWQVFLNEKAQKQQFYLRKPQPAPWESFVAPLRQMAADRQVIHDFVWEEQASAIV